MARIFDENTNSVDVFRNRGKRYGRIEDLQRVFAVIPGIVVYRLIKRFESICDLIELILLDVGGLRRKTWKFIQMHRIYCSAIALIRA